MEGIKQIKSARKHNYLIKLYILIICGLEAHWKGHWNQRNSTEFGEGSWALHYCCIFFYLCTKRCDLVLPHKWLLHIDILCIIYKLKSGSWICTALLRLRPYISILSAQAAGCSKQQWMAGSLCSCRQFAETASTAQLSEIGSFFSLSPFVDGSVLPFERLRLITMGFRLSCLETSPVISAAAAIS